MKLLVCCTALVCLWSAASADDFDIGKVLDQINTELLTGTYTARVEVSRTSDGANNTYTVVEYHDADIGQHSIEYVPLGKKKFFYSDLDPGTVVTVEADRSCKVQDVADALKETQSMVYKSRDPLSPQYFLGPSTVIVEMSTQGINWLSTPNEIVRGIDAKLYSNFGRNDTRGKLINIWFADDWTLYRLSQKDVPFPLRIMISENDVTEQYDFYQIEDLSPKEAFRLGDKLMLPWGLENCALPKPKREPAILLSTFSFTTATDDDIIAEYTTEYFSPLDLLYRADQADGSTVIHDDKRSLIYTLGNGCEAKPNMDADVQILSKGSLNPGARIIQAYQSLPNKTYIGRSYVRGVPVDIWEGVSNGDIKRARFFFAESNAVLSANGDDGSQPLLRAMLLDSFKDDKVLDVKILDFSASESRLAFRKNFNIEDCVEASMYVEIDYEANAVFNKEEVETSNALKELMTATEYAIQENGQVSSLQLPFFKAEVVNEQHLRVYVRILAHEPYLRSYTMRSEKFKPYRGKPVDSPNEEDCAKRCSANSTACPTFLYCGTQCQLMKSNDKSEWGDEEADHEADCNAYDHSPVDQVARHTLDEISDLLENAVMLGYPQFRNTITITTDQTVSLRAVKFFSHLTQFNREGRLGPYMLQSPGASIREKDESSFLVRNKISTVGECYRECKASKNITCSSFSECTSSSRCVLSSMNINSGSHNDPGQPDATQSDTADCAIYSVNYLSEFDRLDGQTRKSGSLDNEAGATAGDCAIKCRQTDLKLPTECRSFDFCPKEKRCFFFTTHYSWDEGADALKVDANCDHYALRYSADYAAVGKGVFANTPVTKVSAVSFEECAKRCSELSNDECKTISYCDSPTPNKEKETCYMYPANVEKLGNDNNRENSCKLYIKDATLVDEVISPKRQLDTEIDVLNKGMGDGVPALLLICMLAVGAVLGAVGYFQRERIGALIGRSSGGSSRVETTISYNRQDDGNPEV